MIGKIKDVCKKHPVGTVIVMTIMLLFAVPLIIQKIYHTPAPCELFEEKIPPGNLLAYIGSVLTFGATFMLSMLVYRSNKEQSERMQLRENKVLLLVDEKKNVKVDLLNPNKRNIDDIFICFECTVLSEAAISKIVMNSLSIEDRNHPRERNIQFYKKYEKEEPIFFKYQNDKKRIKLSFDLKDEKAQKILRMANWIEIAGDFIFYCNNVKTDVTMNINCWSYKQNEDPIAHMEYEIKNSNIYSHNTSLC